MSHSSCVIFSKRSFCSTTLFTGMHGNRRQFFVGYHKKDYWQSRKEYFLSKSTRSFVVLFLQTYTGISNPFTVSVPYVYLQNPTFCKYCNYFKYRSYCYFCKYCNTVRKLCSTLVEHFTCNYLRHMSFTVWRQ
jgi:hypothetical protein